MTGTLVYVSGSGECHYKLKKEMHIPLKPKEDTLCRGRSYKLGNWQKLAYQTAWYMNGNSAEYLFHQESFQNPSPTPSLLLVHLFRLAQWWRGPNSLSPFSPLTLGAGIAQLVVCWIRCPVWCSVAGYMCKNLTQNGEPQGYSCGMQKKKKKSLLWASGRGDFSLGVNMVLTLFPQNSFKWEYKLRSSLCTHAFHCTD